MGLCSSCSNICDYRIKIDDHGNECYHGNRSCKCSKIKTWLYLDASGNIQGPFSSEEMASWARYGFFKPELKIKRKSDKKWSRYDYFGVNGFELGSDKIYASSSGSR